ncbi:RNA exonuclease [Saccharomycopsis crataegensis]|uniref:RNA exonuclease 3 n=1 Tax=Saccharomycopsis crataegensis TaxID=43959 RepID=A0AAV5QIX1_9ASCO|nr:RNA exonuclease [Saccharomycopsis crataegensis]
MLSSGCEIFKKLKIRCPMDGNCKLADCVFLHSTKKPDQVQQPPSRVQANNVGSGGNCSVIKSDTVLRKSADIQETPIKHLGTTSNVPINAKVKPGKSDQLLIEEKLRKPEMVFKKQETIGEVNNNTNIIAQDHKKPEVTEEVKEKHDRDITTHNEVKEEIKKAPHDNSKENQDQAKKQIETRKSINHDMEKKENNDLQDNALINQSEGKEGSQKNAQQKILASEPKANADTSIGMKESSENNTRKRNSDSAAAGDSKKAKLGKNISNNRQSDVMKAAPISINNTSKSKTSTPMKTTTSNSTPKPKDNSSKKMPHKVVLKDVSQVFAKPIMPYPPSTHQQRLKFITLLAGELKKTQSCSIPNKVAIELEYQVASKSSKQIYVGEFKSLVMKVKKKDEQMRKTIENIVRAAKGIKPKKITESKSEKSVTKEDKGDILRKVEKFIHSVETLENNGYVVKEPEITVNSENFAEEKPKAFQKENTKNCERCNATFTPSRSFKGSCKFHPGKKVYSRDSKFKLYYQWDCCQLTFTNSAHDDFGNDERVLGCQTNEHHVFKDSDPGELAKVRQFVRTSQLGDDRSTAAAIVGMDAEMVYTTLGFELARLTVVDFFQSHKVLYDKLVRPQGNIIDYNTRFSGISCINADNSVSWHTMMEELGQIINDTTIIVGHGLENDLNVMRLIHYRIVDTAIIYKDGMRKLSLKYLVQQCLNREIQVGEHDSTEDSVGAIDLVRFRIR